MLTKAAYTFNDLYKHYGRERTTLLKQLKQSRRTPLTWYPVSASQSAPAANNSILQQTSVASSTAPETRNPVQRQVVGVNRQATSAPCCPHAARAVCVLRIAYAAWACTLGCRRFAAVIVWWAYCNVDHRIVGSVLHLPTPMSAFAMAIAQANRLSSDAGIRYELKTWLGTGRRPS